MRQISNESTRVALKKSIRNHFRFSVLQLIKYIVTRVCPAPKTRLVAFEELDIIENSEISVKDHSSAIMCNK